MSGPRVTADDLAGLRQKAEAATPGPWHVERHWDDIMAEDGFLVCADPSGCGTPRNGVADAFKGKPDAAFIAAANPATALALLDDLLAAQTQLAAVRALADNTLTFGGPDVEAWVNLAQLRTALGQKPGQGASVSFNAALAEGPAPETTP